MTPRSTEAVELEQQLDVAPSEEDAQDSLEPEGFAATAESLTAEDGTEPGALEGDEADPVEALKAFVDDLGGLTPRQINAALGQIPGFNRALDKLRNEYTKEQGDTVARLNRTEQLIGPVVTALANSELIADADKAALSTALMQLNQAAQAEQLNRTVDERVAAVTGTGAAPQADTRIADLTAATADIQEYADEIGLGRDRIPQEVWALADEGTATSTLMRKAMKALDEAQGGNATTQRTAKRKTAAGKGTSPAGKVGYSTIDEADGLYADGNITHEEYKVARKKFGIKDSPR